MTPSFDKINYVLRPKKQIERKIIIESLQIIQRQVPINLESYEYLGMGSIYYYDYLLFHKYLNIRNMISLDDKNVIKRFDYNKPFDFIKFKKARTTDFLNTYDFNKHLLCWFDYDSHLWNKDEEELNKYIFDDIEIISRQAKPHDLFLLTVSASCPQRLNEKKLFEDLLSDYLPKDYKHYLNKHLFAQLNQIILLNHIEEKQKRRDVIFHKLFSFKYRDGTDMYTLGGIFLNKDEKMNIVEDKFISFNKGNVCDIDIPLLTAREKLFLDANIDLISDNIDSQDFDKFIEDKLFQISNTDGFRKYLKYYRYYPQYHEGII